VISAQVTSYCCFSANRALSRIFNLIRHRHLLFSSSICLTHGVCK
jgi:hypothetical protein